MTYNKCITGWIKLTVLLSISGMIAVLSGCNNNKADVVYPACDTVRVSLKRDLTPVLVVYCFNCHSAENAPIMGGNHNLQDYSTIRDLVLQDVLIPSIKHNLGSNPMPNSGGMLSDCDINKFIDWKNENAPDN